MPHTITVEPLTRSLRMAWGRHADLGHLAVVERYGVGEIKAVHATTATYAGVYDTARDWARRTGATLVLASSYAPTVVGSDIAAGVAARPDCQPLPVYVLAYDTIRDGREVTVTRSPAPAEAIETVGKVINRLADRGEAWNIQVLDGDGNDVTFDFSCFAGGEQPPAAVHQVSLRGGPTLDRGAELEYRDGQADYDG